MTGFQTLLTKEILGFWKVAFQTIAAPMLTAILYLMIFFGHVMAGSSAAFRGSYEQFLIPGLAMMSMLQNAFANTSSSLIQSKLTGNIVFILLPPLTHWDYYLAYTSQHWCARCWWGWAFSGGYPHGARSRGATVIDSGIRDLGKRHSCSDGHHRGPVGGEVRPTGGVPEFHRHAAHVLGPACSIRSTPCRRSGKAVSHANPFFYLIDGFRYGFFGQSDVAISLSLSVTMLSFLVLSAVTLYLIKSGYRLRN